MDADVFKAPINRWIIECKPFRLEYLINISPYECQSG